MIVVEGYVGLHLVRLYESRDGDITYHDILLSAEVLDVEIGHANATEHGCLLTYVRCSLKTRG